MWDIIKGLAKGFLSSKKAVAFLSGLLASLLVILAAKTGIGLSEEQAGEYATKVVALVAAYVLGQGIADHGKEAAKAKVEAEAAQDDGS